MMKGTKEITMHWPSIVFFFIYNKSSIKKNSRQKSKVRLEVLAGSTFEWIANILNANGEFRRQN